MGLFLLGCSRCTFAGRSYLGGCGVVFSSRSLLRFLRGGILFRSGAFVCLRLGRIGSGLIFAFAVGRFALRSTTSLLTFLACFGAFVFAVFSLGVAFCSVFVLLFTARFRVFALGVFVFSIFFLRLRRNFVEKIQSSRHIVISYLVRQMDLDIVEATAVMDDLEKSGLIQIQPSGELEIKEWGGIS